MNSKKDIAIIGGGLAGCECANILLRLGLSVDLYEMKPKRFSEAHKSELLAELVCSNSLKSNDFYNPQGLLKEEMKRFGSLIIEAAENTNVPAGQSLSVDRELFSRYITRRLTELDKIEIIREEISDLDLLKSKYSALIVASGPLTTNSLSINLRKLAGADDFLYFYDAISPIITSDSIDMTKAFLGSRYNKGGDDYINCPLNKVEYKEFYDAIINAEYVKPHIDENLNFFEGCLPVEEIANRGFESLIYGPFKPVGFGFEKRNMPFAIVQLRPENREKTLYSIVAFQTRMKYGSQEKVIRLIPALKNCEIVRYGQMHRNIYFNSPKILSKSLSVKNNKNIFIAGTLTGVEGYVEAAASGIITALSVYSFVMNKEFLPPPDMTAMGLLYRYMIGEISTGKHFVPTNINKGLFLHKGAKRYTNEMADEAIRLIDEYVKAIDLKK